MVTSPFSVSFFLKRRGSVGEIGSDVSETTVQEYMKMPSTVNCQLSVGSICLTVRSVRRNIIRDITSL